MSEAHALLLRAVDYRDSDRIVTLLTREHGKLSALARGARRSKRRFAGALEPYAVLKVELKAGRSELWTLAEATIDRAFPGVLGSLERMNRAGAALALVRELSVERAGDAELFVTCVQLLTVLDAEDDPNGERLLAFAVRVLALAGVAPHLNTCGRCDKAAPPGRAAYFDPAAGGIVCRGCGGGAFRLSGAALAHLRNAQTDGWLEAARGDWDEADRNAARVAVAAFLAFQLGEKVAARVFP